MFFGIEYFKIVDIFPGSNILPMEPSESITNPHELDETVYKFTEACNSAFKVACPAEKPRGRKKPPWWTQQLSILRNQLQMPV